MNQQPTNISFEKTKKACNDKQSGAYLIARDVYENDGKKQFARIDDFPEFSSYIQTLPLEERCFYECIEENKPVKWHLDFDCKTALPEDVKQINIGMIIDNIVHAFEPYEVTKDDIVILNSSSDTKTSFHFILNKIHFQNIKSLKFLKDNVFKSLFDTVDFLDGVIYGVRCFRMPMCTKYGKDRHLNIVSNHSFLDALITYIPENSILLEMKEDIKKTVVQPVKLLPNNEQCGLEQCFIKNVSLFSEYASDYSKWVSVGIKLYRANCNVETFKLFSRLSPKYNEHICEKKWDSFQHYDKNSNSLINFMTFVGIKVNIGDNDIFEDCIFNKKHLRDDMLIYPPLGRPYVDPLYIDFVIKYINRFFCIIALTKTEYFRIEYNEYNKPCKLTHRYSKQSL